MSAFTVLAIKALMMIGVVPSQAKKANADDEVARLLIDNVRLANDLSLARAEARAARDELARLTQASHRCQHQAQLNRAFAQTDAPSPDMLAYLQAQQAVNLHAYNALGQINALNFGDCARMLNDCGMHRAEQMMTRQMPAPATRRPPEPAEIAAPTRALRVTLVSHRRAGKSAVERALDRLPVTHD